MKYVKESDSFREEYEQDLVKFMSSIYSMAYYIDDLNHLSGKFENFKFDIYLIGFDRWLNVDKKLEGFHKEVHKWIQEIVNKSKVSLSTNSLGLEPTDIYGENNRYPTLQDYTKVIYNVLKRIKEYAKESTEYYNKLNIELPMNRYPFNCPMEELYDEVRGWVDIVIGPLSEIAMGDETLKAIKKINKD
tara:strand:- start:69955 stop:70521 length:567 start_codon:yes stop_codon:yes gene_type:complete